MASDQAWALQGWGDLTRGTQAQPTIYGCVPPTASSGWPIPYRSPFRNNSQTNWPPNQTTRRVFTWSLWFPSLTRFKLSDHQHQCVAYLGMTGMSRWFFWAPGTQGRSRGINNVAGLVLVKQWPHYPLFACSTIVQNVFLPKVTMHLSKWFQWNNGLQASLPAVCSQCHLTIAKCISPTS